MNSTKKILCAVDFGELTEKILLQAKELAGFLNAKVYVIYVVRPLDTIEQFAVPKSFREQYINEILGKANEKVKELKETIGADEKFEFLIKSGDPVKEILDLIEKEKIDMVIIGAVSKKTFGETLFGSVGEKVLKLSKVPVLVIK